MARRFALYFWVVGYIVAVYSSTPHEWPASPMLFHVLWYSCFACVNDLHGVIWTLLILAPINGVLYGVVGFAIGKITLRFRRAPG